MITDLQRGDFFQKGQRYRRKQIHKLYKGQEQSEISTPKAYPYIFIFTRESGSEYGTGHGWNKDKTSFFYTGEGQRGSMQLIKGNKALREHFQSGKAVYLFHYVEPGVVEFIDEVTYINHQLEIMWDSDGELREAIIFELERNPVIEEKAAKLDVSAYSTEQLRHIALEKEKKTSVYEQTAALKQYVHKRAGGICEACGESAPFIARDGSTFLQMYYISKLSEGGLARTKDAAALCPNCHSRLRYGKYSEVYEEELITKINKKETGEKNE
ncbi:HNH endonuclease [Priestia aryabhattai]|uniref:HNH endonuclease n=1 Tax=Priestia megaterium TaxID=1404 RepID=UPI0039B88AF6